MSNVAVTHPGKLGDALYALPTIRQLAIRHNCKVDFFTSQYCLPLKRLFEYQGCIDKFKICEDYTPLRFDCGIQPWQMPVPDDYPTIYHLGFRGTPHTNLPSFIASQAGVTPERLYYEYPDQDTGSDYVVFATRGEERFLPVLQGCHWPIVQIGSANEYLGGIGLNKTGLDMLDTLACLAHAKAFVGGASSLLALANGFPIPKIVPHDGNIDMRHLLYSDKHFYPAHPAPEAVLRILDTALCPKLDHPSQTGWRTGIIMPVWLQNEQLLNLTKQAVASIKTASCARLFVVTTRLHICAPPDLEKMLNQVSAVPVTVIHTPFLARSVANAWNEGCRQALAWGANRLMIMANDVLLESETVDSLLSFNDPGVALWSGIDTRDKASIEAGTVSDGADFSCFMLRPETITKHGEFDERYRPAYFEDNDYYARVVLGGDSCSVVHAAKFFHYGSMTSRLDPDNAHHVKHWFGINQRRFASKWGVPQPARNREDLASYYRHPWNDATLPLDFWQRD